MSDLKAIKERLLEEGRVEIVLEALGCTYIGYSGGRVEAQLPERFDSHNKRGVQVKLNSSLTSSIRVPVGFIGGDIYSLVSFLKHDKNSEDEIRKDLHDAKEFICLTLGWTEYLSNTSFKTKKDYVAPLKALMKGATHRKEIIPNKVLPDDVMNQFYINGKPLPFSRWIDEGISYDTQVIYGVGFDWESHRVVYPLKNRLGQVVGVKGRIMKDEDSDKKYMYIYRCNNRYEWFNWHYAQPYILEEKRVFIFESEKSCMKAFEYGVYNTLAIGASDMSPEQVDMVKNLGLDIDIVLCYDEGIDIDAIKHQAKLYRGREIKTIYDIEGLLGHKDSPIDCGIEIWNKLVNNYIFEVNLDDLED